MAKKQYIIDERGDGAFKKRGDGAFSYAGIPVSVLGTGIRTVIFMYDSFNKLLWSVPIGGGTPINRIPVFEITNMKCDAINHVLFWTNVLAAGSNTYTGNSAVWAVRYQPQSGAFLTDPVQIISPNASTSKTLFPDAINKKLYYNQSLAIKRGSYIIPGSLSSIEYMAVPSGNYGDAWKGSTDSIYFADDGIGGVDILETKLTGTPPEYLETDQYYDDGSDYDQIDCDETRDLMFINNTGNANIRVMTLSNPTDMTVFVVASSGLYSGWALDSSTGFIYINHWTDLKLYRYEYGSRLPVNQVEILDYSDFSITNLIEKIALG